MICPNCKKRISKDDKFCGYCGSRINFKEEKSNYPKVLDKHKIEYISRPRKQDIQKRHTSIIHTLHNHWKATLWIIIALFIFWSIISDSGFGTREFPELAEPKTITFEWKYNGFKYVITETFYKTVYDYYNSNPDKHCWQEVEDYEICLKRFLEEAKEDNTISKIASDIKTIALKERFGGDELLELTVAFVQSIPYDEDRFELIAHPNKLEDLYPNYPYEVLYNNKGVCAGKTFLAVSLIKELDYGVAMFYYEPVIEDEVGHIVPAIECSKEYSSYDSGYCYTEITEKGFKIGEIPIDIDDGIAKTRTAINLFEEENIFDSDNLGLGNAEIYVIAYGDSYYGIINTMQTIERVEKLEKEMDTLYRVINSLDKEAQQLENSVDYYDQQSEAAYKRHMVLEDYSSYNEYSRLYSQYESAHKRYESKLNEYNKKIDKYNDFVEEYNVLIEDFYK
ncbi:MAG: zinc ribbon domain-containing protein [Minisyncoccales bacterium]